MLAIISCRLFKGNCKKRKHVCIYVCTYRTLVKCNAKNLESNMNVLTYKYKFIYSDIFSPTACPCPF